MKDATTVVIGGLIKDNEERAPVLGPCLGDIPILGTLFRPRRSKEKTNLMIFLTPAHHQDTEDLEAITRTKREEYEKHGGTARASPASRLQRRRRTLGASRIR